MSEFLDRLFGAGPSAPACIFVTLVVNSLFKFATGEWLQRKRDQGFRAVARVAGIYLYPVKSCAGVALEEARCTCEGLCFGDIKDRHWMVVKDNVFLTQRQQPKMALIVPSFQGNELCLNAPEMETLTLKKDFNCSHSKVVKCRIWEVHLDAVDCGDEASQWISKYLSLDGLRIFFSAPFLEKRHIDEEDCDEQENYAIPGDMSTFPDYAPYNLLSQSSIDELNKRLDKPVTVKNFRPNILVEGCTSFAEDSWSEIRIGNKMRFRVLNNCLRCLLTTVDPETGVKNPSMEPLQTLKKFRKLNYKYSPAFGMQLAPDSEGPIKVGDPVYALPRD